MSGEEVVRTIQEGHQVVQRQLAHRQPVTSQQVRDHAVVIVGGRVEVHFLKDAKTAQQIGGSLDIGFDFSRFVTDVVILRPSRMFPQCGWRLAVELSDLGRDYSVALAVRQTLRGLIEPTDFVV